MNSLRARLIWGFSLVAVLPLTLAMLLLGTRIQHTVRAQAATRLDLAIGVVQTQMRSDGDRLQQQLSLLARDPQLKRLVLVPTGGDLELRQYLADQRFLLGLDYLVVTDTLGAVLGDAASAAAMHGDDSPLGAEHLPPRADDGLTVASLAGGPALALDVRAGIPWLDRRAGIVRAGIRLDSAFLARLQRSSGLELVLRDPHGSVVATTLRGRLAPEPRAADTTVGVVRLDGRSWFTREADLRLGAHDSTAAHLTALASTAAADDAIGILRSTAIVLGLLGVLLAIVLGIVWSHQVARPVVRLAGFSERIARGEWDEPLALESMRELQTLVDALERMRTDLRRYRDNLRASERQAAYGQMARKVAHEIKNPLTPIAIAVQGLKRSYDQQHPDFGATLDDAVRTVSEEIHRLKTLLQEFSDLGRFPSPRPVRFVLGDLMGDLRTLHLYDVEAGRLSFDSPPMVLPLVADRDQLRQVLLNLIQNGLDATAAGGGRVRVSAALRDDALCITVRDDGPGMSEEQRAQLFVPGFTTKAHGSGLGLTIVERIVADHGGTIAVDSAPGRGTTFEIRLPQGTQE
jgi:nitrogen fixation/metabolism regulation signal transduction histidine kinase